MNLIDCHTHTQFSMDSEADIISCIERAREIGLTAQRLLTTANAMRGFLKSIIRKISLISTTSTIRRTIMHLLRL